MDLMTSKVKKVDFIAMCGEVSLAHARPFIFPLLCLSIKFICS